VAITGKDSADKVDAISAGSISLDVMVLDENDAKLAENGVKR